jgi:predicted RNase H-like HicB family nuclease
MLKVDKTLVFASWIVVEPAEDIPGVWVGHCLDFDVISQGDSPHDAIDSVNEAIAMTVVDDLHHGLDPNERRAPAEFWDRLVHILKHGDQVNSPR